MAPKLQLLHEEQGHNRIQYTLALMREHFFWITIYQDVTNWDKLCKTCKKAKGLHNNPNGKQGSLIANYPLDLLCLDFRKMDCSKDGKKNVLIMMDASSNFTVVVVMPNKQTNTVAKALVDRWLYTYGMPSRIHSDWGKSFDNQIIHHLCTMMESNNLKEPHITHEVIPSVRGLIELYMTCFKHCPSHKL